MGGKGDENHAPHEGTEHETRKDKLSKELEVIRNRRTGGSGRSFLAKKENFVLFGGIVYGGFYALMIFAMSSGMLGESTALDHAASTTFLDIGGECEEITDEPWIHMFPNEDLRVFSLAGHNLPEGFAALSFEITSTDEGQEWWSKANSTVSTVKFKGGSETGRSNYRADYSDLNQGHYSITFEISVYNQSNLTGASIVEGGEQIDKTIEFEISESKQTLAFLPFVDDETKQEIRVTDTGARSCWSVQDLGDWGYILIGAELGGIKPPKRRDNTILTDKLETTRQRTPRQDDQLVTISSLG